MPQFNNVIYSSSYVQHIMLENLKYNIKLTNSYSQMFSNTSIPQLSNQYIICNKIW